MGVFTDNSTSVSTEFEKIPNLTKYAKEAAVKSFEEHLNELVESVRGLEIRTNPCRELFQMMKDDSLTKSTKQSTAEEFQDVCQEFFEKLENKKPPVITIHTDSSPDKSDFENSPEINSLRWQKKVMMESLIFMRTI
jgi:hypothetical protein